MQNSINNFYTWGSVLSNLKNNLCQRETSTWSFTCKFNTIFDSKEEQSKNLHKVFFAWSFSADKNELVFLTTSAYISNSWAAVHCTKPATIASTTTPACIFSTIPTKIVSKCQQNTHLFKEKKHKTSAIIHKRYM